MFFPSIEEKWLKQLAHAAAEEMPGMTKRTTRTNRKIGSKKNIPVAVEKTEALPRMRNVRKKP